MGDSLFERWKQRREKSRRRLVPATAGMLACCLSSALAAQPTVRKIVDGADPVPGAPQAAWESFRPFFDVAADGDDVAFIGSSSEGGAFRHGVYAHRGGSLQLVADSETTRPGTSVPFASFWRIALDGGRIAFTNEDLEAAQAGAYVHGPNGLQVVADHRTTIPGQGPERFRHFGDIALHDGSVLFGAGVGQHFGVWQQDGLYRSDDGLLATVADSSTPIPAGGGGGGGGSFQLLGEVGLDDDGLAFTMPRPNSTAEDGIYRNLGNGIEPVADLSTVAPHTGTPFTSFFAFSYDTGKVAFVAGAANQGAVYLHDGSLRTIATPQTPYPGSGRNFAGFSNRIATSEGRVAFLGFWNPPGEPSRSGLFVADGSELLKITEQGAQLDGRVVSDIDLSQGALDWPHLAFAVVFADGGNALYLASFEDEAGPCVPGPTALCLNAGRFEVEATWRTAQNQTGPAMAVPLTADSGYFWFFNAANAELFVKVNNACVPPFDRFWFFAAGLTDVHVVITVTDTETGESKTYVNTLGRPFQPIQDTQAFATCP